VWIEKAGHSPQLECPELVAQHVCSFLGIDKPRASQQPEQAQPAVAAAAAAVQEVASAVVEASASQEKPTAAAQKPATEAGQDGAGTGAAPQPELVGAAAA
jgi:hypothetical protein